MKYFFPDYYFHCIDELSPEFFLSREISHIIFDIDDTLVKHGVEHPSEETVKLLTAFHNAGLHISFISNSKGDRAKIFAAAFPFETLVISNAKKPSKKALIPFFDHSNASIQNTAFVGDQLLTDIWLCKKWKMLNILVKPIAQYENPFFYFKRAIERPILNAYFKQLEQENSTKDD